VHTEFWWRNLREGDHLEDPSIDGKTILTWNSCNWDGGAWTELIAQDKDSLLSLGNVVMNLQVP